MDEDEREIYESNPYDGTDQDEDGPTVAECDPFYDQDDEEDLDLDDDLEILDDDLSVEEYEPYDPYIDA